MNSDLFQSDADRLSQIASQFGQQAEMTQQWQQELHITAAQLLTGGWSGRGATSFQHELEEHLQPALTRLIETLQDSKQTTLKIITLVQQADIDGAHRFYQGAQTPTPTPTQMPEQSPTDLGSGIWQRLEHNADHSYTFGLTFNDKGISQGGTFGVTHALTIGTDEMALWGDPGADGFTLIGGSAEAGARISFNEGLFLGVGADYHTARGQYETTLLGDENWGATGGIEAELLSATGFAGVKWEDGERKIGAEIGGTLISAEGSLGVNVAGYNGSVTGEIGLKAELGFTLSDDDVEIKLPFFSVGLEFGEAIN